MFSFIPRLVVHKEEIDRIFFPDAQLLLRRRTVAVETTPESPAVMIDDNSDDQTANSDDLDTVVVPDVILTLPGIIARLASQVPGTIVQIASDIPYSVAQMANDIPGTISVTKEMALETLRIPYRVLQDLPLRMVRLSSGVVREVVELPLRVVQMSSDIAREVVEMPHKASHSWKELVWVLALLVLSTIVVSGLVFFLPLAPANAGLAANRNFLYGIMTYYEALALLPWIETCNFALPNAKIPVRARILTLVAGLAVQKLFDAFVAEAFWLPNFTVFPIPFSIIVSGALGFLVVVPMLYWMTPRRKEFNFFLLWRVLCIYWLSLILVGCWAVGMRRLEGRTTLQSFVGFLFGPIRFVCKILLAAPLTTQLSPRRWLVLNLVVDILFTRVQISTLPFIDGIIPLLLLFGTEVLTLLWRYYLGIDRLALWWTAISRLVLRSGECTDFLGSPCLILQEFGTSVRDLTTGCFSAPIPHISQLSLTLRNSLRDLQSIDLAALAVRTNSLQNSLTPATITIEEGVEAKEDDEQEAAASESDAEACSQGSDKTSNTEDQKDVPVEPPAVPPSLSPLPSPISRDELLEEHWEQRPLYHVIDAVGSTVISIIVRLNQQLSMSLVRNLPASVHLNESFHASDERWKRAQIYAWIFIFLMLVLLASLGGIFFTRLERLHGNRRLTLSRVITYLYRDHFWFFFLWLSATGGYVCATMIQHFGADFTLKFLWVQCPNHMAWPGCAEL